MRHLPVLATLTLTLGCGRAARPAAPTPAAVPSPTVTTTPSTASAPAAAPTACAPPPPPAPTLASLGLSPYDPDARTPFPDGWAAATPLADDELSPAFDNLDDLAWLGPIARDHKVILLGENHYGAVVHHLAHRVFFALQRGAPVPLLTMEQPYSLGPFLDHYVNLLDDDAAARFRAEALVDLPLSTEDLTLIARVRAWNQAHPDARLHLATHDVEHQPEQAIARVLAPYAGAVDPTAKVSADDFARDPERFLAAVTAVVARGRARRVVGPYPFLTADLAAAVLDNLQAAWLAGGQGVDYYRQRAITRNLTEPTRLGRWFRTGKVMLWGGSYHTAIRHPAPDGGAFLREGTYLARAFAPTRGKVFAIRVQWLAISLGAMAGVDRTVLPPTGYAELVARLQDAHTAGALAADQAVYPHGSGPLASGGAALARQTDHGPLRVGAVAWPLIELAARKFSLEQQVALANLRRELGEHDELIIVPRTPLIEVLPRPAAP